MERPIKFRGKRKDNGEWVYGGIATVPTRGDYELHITSTRFYEGDEDNVRLITIPVDPKTIGQFIGQKDKNGKEIYEGDAFKHLLSNHQTIIGYVTWSNKGLGFYVDFKGKGMAVLRALDETEQEIIGNIHDNPSLVKN